MAMTSGTGPLPDSIAGQRRMPRCRRGSWKSFVCGCGVNRKRLPHPTWESAWARSTPTSPGSERSTPPSDALSPTSPDCWSGHFRTVWCLSPNSDGRVDTFPVGPSGTAVGRVSSTRAGTRTDRRAGPRGHSRGRRSPPASPDRSRRARRGRLEVEPRDPWRCAPTTCPPGGPRSPRGRGDRRSGRHQRTHQRCQRPREGCPVWCAR